MEKIIKKLFRDFKSFCEVASEEIQENGKKVLRDVGIFYNESIDSINQKRLTDYLEENQQNIAEYKRFQEEYQAIKVKEGWNPDLIIKTVNSECLILGWTGKIIFYRKEAAEMLSSMLKVPVFESEIRLCKAEPIYPHSGNFKLSMFWIYEKDSFFVEFGSHKPLLGSAKGYLDRNLFEFKQQQPGETFALIISNSFQDLKKGILDFSNSTTYLKYCLKENSEVKPLRTFYYDKDDAYAEKLITNYENRTGVSFEEIQEDLRWKRQV